MFYDTTELATDEIYLKLLSTNLGNRRDSIPPSYNFIIKKKEDMSEIGQCTFRVGHSKHNDYSGNIGYTIYERYRGNNYAQKTCSLLFKLAANHSMKYLYICCSPENNASVCICKRLGGEFLGEYDIPSWHPLYDYDKKKVLRYIFKKLS